MHQAPSDEEKEFLHEIASPICAAMFIMDMISDDFRPGENGSESLLVQILRAKSSLDRAKQLLEARRALLRRRAPADVLSV